MQLFERTQLMLIQIDYPGLLRLAAVETTKLAALETSLLASPRRRTLQTVEHFCV